MSHKTKPKFRNLDKGLEVIRDVDRGGTEVGGGGPKQSNSPSLDLADHVQVDYILEYPVKQVIAVVANI